MRSAFLIAASLMGVGLCAYLSARSADQVAAISLTLVDAQTGKPMGGMVRVLRTENGRPVPLPGLLSRLRGLEKTEQASGWCVVGSSGARTQILPGTYKLQAVSGLETPFVEEEITVEAGKPFEHKVTLRAVFRPEDDNLTAGNTHLHLRNLSLEESDDYLRQIPAADGLKVMFISYLLRQKDDLTYITNRYPIGDLPQFKATGVLFNNGEEHRHNFEGFGQGYGHVMLLDIKKLIEPVSIGPGIAGLPYDEPSLSVGIDEARRQGGTVIWCHNTNGHEDVVNALAGRLHALNVYDGSRTGSYEENYYRYLNVGLRMPISTGTDWFMYDFSRVYARVEGPLTIRSWLEAVRAGRCVATNGPLLRLTVDGQSLGGTVKLDQPRSVRVEASGIGRHDFQRLELVHNGKVIHVETTEKGAGSFSAKIRKDVAVDGPGWFAVRIQSTTKNEFDRELYAHSSPVYVEQGGRRIFEPEAARALMKQLEEGLADIRARGRFSSPQAEEKVLTLYRQATRELANRLGN